MHCLTAKTFIVNLKTQWSGSYRSYFIVSVVLKSHCCTYLYTRGTQPNESRNREHYLVYFLKYCWLQHHLQNMKELVTRMS